MRTVPWFVFCDNYQKPSKYAYWLGIWIALQIPLTFWWIYFFGIIAINISVMPVYSFIATGYRKFQTKSCFPL